MMSNRANANRKRKNALKKPSKNVMGWMEFETAREIIERRSWNLAIKGAAKDKVPILDLSWWLNRPIP